MSQDIFVLKKFHEMGAPYRRISTKKDIPKLERLYQGISPQYVSIASSEESSH